MAHYLVSLFADGRVHLHLLGNASCEVKMKGLSRSQVFQRLIGTVFRVASGDMCNGELLRVYRLVAVARTKIKYENPVDIAIELADINRHLKTLRK